MLNKKVDPPSEANYSVIKKNSIKNLAKVNENLPDCAFVLQFLGFLNPHRGETEAIFVDFGAPCHYGPTIGFLFSALPY